MPNRIIAAIGAVTAAMRAERTLRAAGIAAEVVALDADQTRRGCAFGVAFPSQEEARARQVLRAARISISQYIKERAM